MIWAIVSDDEHGDNDARLFWSNLDGWVPESLAQSFTDDEIERFHLPIGGRWVPHPEVIELVEHIEIEHERELAPALELGEIRSMHKAMHRMRDDWGHKHG